MRSVCPRPENANVPNSTCSRHVSAACARLHSASGTHRPYSDLNQPTWTRWARSNIACAKSAGQIDSLSCAGGFSRVLQWLRSGDHDEPGPARNARPRARETRLQVNLKAELEIRHLHQKIDHLLSHQWERLVEIQEIQMESINETRDHK